MTSSEILITPDERIVITEILKRVLPEGSKVWVFGSRLKGGRVKPFSDLDLAFDCGQEPMDLALLADLRDAFEESSLPYKVDMVDLHQINPDFLAIINAKKARFFPAY